MSKRKLSDDLSDVERAALADRIRAMVESVGTQAEAAAVAGVSIGQLKAYVLGNSAPSFLPIARLARASGFDLNWVATGEGERQPRAPSVGENLRDAVRRGERTRLAARFARRLGGALERLYGVEEDQLPTQVDDRVEPIAEQVAAITLDEPGALELARRIVELVEAVRD